jgi:hypothetical protein
MSIPALIASAASEYNGNTGFLERAVSGIAPEQWLIRPNDHSNHITWIVGHVVWARQILVNRVGRSWSQPGLEIFARGVKLDPSITYPAPEALLAAWRESAGVLTSTLESLTPEALAAPAPPGPPSPDGKVSGFIGVLAWHESYHLGQICYLRSWLGYPGAFG